jgi:hypothetical protein
MILKEFAIFKEGVDTFAGGDGDAKRGDGIGHLLERGGILRRHRFFKPTGFIGGEQPRKLNSRDGVEAPVHLDQDFCLWPHSVTHRLDQADDLDLFGALHLIEACAKGVKFERLIAAGDHPPCRRMKLLWRALDGIPAIGIGFDLVAHRAPQEAVDRLAQRLAHNVPTRHLDQGNAGHHQFPSATIILDIHAVDQLLDIKGVAAQDIAGHCFLEIADHRFGAVDDARIGNPYHSFIGLYFDKGYVAPFGSHRHRCNFTDLHSFPLIYLVF